LFEPEGDMTKTIGALTSSTLSPMLGNVAIGFAMIRWGSHQPGTAVSVHAEGKQVEGTVQELSFLS
jgi:glycine cleavage system aminomethyltransferase T